MGFDKIKKKSMKMGKKPASMTLKVNEYENPQMALNLVAHICTTSETIDVSSCFEDYYELLGQMNEEYNKIVGNENGDEERTFELAENCNNVGFWLEDAIVSNLSSSLKIAVAGGYSAGKSSLLNSLTKIGHLLPTGVEPVSVVNTFLNCRSDIDTLAVKGINLKDELVLLNEEVLECIQHSSKSKTYIAPVLKKIIIDVPSGNQLDHITFVDTPGYNNSSDSSESDKDSAIAALNDCNAVFWCIDIEAGTITNEDLQILRQCCEDKPIVIIYTKMDKKSDDEIKRIVNATQKICMREFGQQNMPIDIIAISATRDTMYSATQASFDDIVNQIRSNCGIETDWIDMYKNYVSNLFDEYIDSYDNQINEIENERISALKEKSDYYNTHQNATEHTAKLKNALRDILIDNYDELMSALDEYGDCYNQAMDGWSDSLDREEDEWPDKVGIFSDASDVARRRDEAVTVFEELNDRDLENFESWNDEIRQNIYNDVCENYIDSNDARLSKILEYEEENYNEIVSRKKTFKKLKNFLVKYQPLVIEALGNAYDAAIDELNQYLGSLQRLGTPSGTIDVFAAINGDNFKSFLACFSKGVDLSVCNSEGYSPITYAVRSGNNEMVKFFIDHDVDMSMKDNRGYNALETAAMCHYRDMCEILIEKDRSLLNGSQSLTELAKKNDFEEWVSKIN